MISEDHYIDFLASTRLETLVPKGLLVPLLNSALLFLGYRLKDWNLRVILHELWSNRDFGYPAWAVHRDVDEVDAAIWRSRNVMLFDAGAVRVRRRAQRAAGERSGPTGRLSRGVPYLGLTPYGEADAELFFGRRAERDLVVANLLTSRLTVMYGPSGVGKSSLLRAGVLPRLRAAIGVPSRRQPAGGRARRRLAGRPGAGHPRRGRRRGRRPRRRRRRAHARRGAGALRRAAGGILLLVLDQFEEYFLYHGRERRPPAPRAAARARAPRLRARVLISLREDALASLDLLEGSASSLFGNLLRLGPMSDAAAARGDHASRSTRR